MINTSAHTSPKARKGLGRALTTLAATAAAGLLALGMAAPAAAEPVTPYDGGVKGEYSGNVESGVRLNFEGHDPIGTTLFELTLESGETLPAYCIDFETDIVPGADYEEGQWEEYPGEGDFADSQPGKVLWILQNSYPRVDAAALGEAAEIRGLNKKQALSGTQAAIWHFSNGVELSDNNDDNVKALYEYLLETATEVEQTPASLTITPNEASGESGSAIGEFVVSTTADSVPLSIDNDNLVILGSEGDEISEISDGQQFSVGVPDGTADGEATVSGTVQATVQLGRLFKGVDPEKPTQTLITAGEGQTEASAQAKVTWTTPVEPSPSPSPSPTPSTPDEEPTPTPTPSTPGESPVPSPTPTTPDDRPGLPVTGAALGGLIAAAVVAIGGGGAAMYLSRKRKSGNGA